MKQSPCHAETEPSPSVFQNKIKSFIHRIMLSGYFQIRESFSNPCKSYSNTFYLFNTLKANDTDDETECI